MTRRWWSDADAARDLLGRVSSDDGVSGAGAALLGLHALGAQALSGLAGSTAVSVDEVRSALAGVDHSSAADAWQVTAGSDLDGVKAAADAGALEIVDTLTSAGVPWPLALQRASEGYGLPPGEAAVYASKVAAPILPPPVVADVADVALGSWAASTSAQVSEPVSKAEEDWIEVRVGGRRLRRRVLRDEEGQFARQGEGEGGQQKREARVFDGSKLPMAEYKQLSQAEKDAYMKARREVAQQRKRRKERRVAREQAEAKQFEANREVMRRQVQEQRQAQIEALRAPATQVKVNTDRLKDAQEQRKQRIRERAKKIKQQKGPLARKYLDDLAARRKTLKSQDFDTVDVDQSALLVDALAAVWPAGYPQDKAMPGGPKAREWLMTELAHTSFEQLGMLESDAKTLPDEPHHYVQRWSNAGDDSVAVPVLTTTVYGVQMLQRARNHDEIPAFAFYGANAGWKHRDYEGIKTNEFDVPPPENPGMERPLFRFRVVPPDAPLVTGDVEGQLLFNIPLNSIVSASRQKGQGHDVRDTNPLLNASLVMTDDTRAWLESAQKLYLGLADIEMPVVGLADSQMTQTALDLLSFDGGMHFVTEIAEVFNSPSFSETLLAQTAKIDGETFTYPQTAAEASAMWDKVQAKYGDQGQTVVMDVLRKYKSAMLLNTFMQIEDDDPAKAYEMANYVSSHPGLMPSLFDYGAPEGAHVGWDEDRPDKLYAAIELVQKFANEVGTTGSPQEYAWNTLRTVDYKNDRTDGLAAMTTDREGVSRETLHDLAVRMTDTYGDTKDGREFTRDLIDVVLGADRKG